MPEYSKTDITDLVDRKDAELLVAHASNYRDKCLLSLLWLIPVRPKELMSLKRKDFKFFKDDDERPLSIEFTIVTKKLRKKKFFPKREFEFKRGKIPEIMFKSIWRHVRSIGSERAIFDMTDRNMRFIVDRVSMRALGRNACPYLFRHSSLTRFAKEGAGVEQLMYLKGSADVGSVSPYLHGKKQDIEVK